MAKKLNTEQFIKKAKQVHGDKYDYSETKYINSRSKVKIICPKHGIFEQGSCSHLSGKGCSYCGNETRRRSNITKIDEFIKKASKVHNNFYDYSKVNYITLKDKVIIICPFHKEFKQKAITHLQGHGCPECSKLKRKNKKLLTIEQFIKRSNKIHNNKYNYSQAKYINAKSKIKIICPEHDEFWQTPNSHLLGHKCPKCAFYKLGLNKPKTSQSEFIQKANIKHDNFYNYSLIKYKDCRIKIEIICPIHGPFWQKPKEHLKGCGCNKCQETKYEKEIRIWLEKNNIKYISQYKFKNCKYNISLRFDFYLPDYNMCIEYDGEFHYLPITYKGCKTKEAAENRLFIQKQKDSIKDQYCLDNNIKLIRIPYWKKNNIKEILNLYF